MSYARRKYLTNISEPKITPQLERISSRWNARGGGIIFALVTWGVFPGAGPRFFFFAVCCLFLWVFRENSHSSLLARSVPIYNMRHVYDFALKHSSLELESSPVVSGRKENAATVPLCYCFSLENSDGAAAGRPISCRFPHGHKVISATLDTHASGDNAPGWDGMGLRIWETERENWV